MSATSATLAGALGVSGATGIGLGGALTALRLRPGLLVQAAGTAALGACGVWVLAGGDRVGAAFRSSVGPALGLDGLSAFFLVVLAVVAVPALVFAGGYLSGHERARPAGVLLAGFVLALAGVIAARDISLFLGFWEAMTLLPAAAILVGRRDRVARSAVYTYLAITHVGGVGVWIAVLVLGDRGAFGNPAAMATSGAGVQTLVALAALIGFGTKAGLVPLHTWLPRAHPVAPAPFSALMSAVMVAVALYGLIRVELQWLGATPRWLGLVLLGLGALSAVAGGLWALAQAELKRVLAFSTIENVGIVTVGLGATLLATDAGDDRWAAVAFAAAMLHVATHALAKGVSFLGAGAFERAAGGLGLDRLGGLLERMPITGTAFLIGTASLAGVPPLAGFVSEWLTLQALIHIAFTAVTGVALASAAAVVAVAAAAAIAVYYSVQMAGLVLLGRPRREEIAATREPAPAMRSALVALAGGVVLLALLAGTVVPTLAELAPASRAGSSVSAGVAIALPGTGVLHLVPLAAALLVLVAPLAALRGRRVTAVAPTWACGQDVVPELGFTAAGFTKPLQLVVEMFAGPTRGLAGRGGARAIRTGLQAAALARRLQSGSVRTYAGYLLVLVLTLLVLARVGALG